MSVQHIIEYCYNNNELISVTDYKQKPQPSTHGAALWKRTTKNISIREHTRSCHNNPYPNKDSQRCKNFCFRMDKVQGRDIPITARIISKVLVVNLQISRWESALNTKKLGFFWKLCMLIKYFVYCTLIILLFFSCFILPFLTTCNKFLFSSILYPVFF